MGLDIEPMGRARGGSEAEWSALLTMLYGGGKLSAAQQRRLMDISVPPWTEIGAPVVGQDSEADRWLLARARAAGDARPDADIIRENSGYHVVSLLLGKCDGVPAYSNGALGYVEATSFRGEFLKDCSDFLTPAIIEAAWRDVIPPEEAVRYGRQLLAALDFRPGEARPTTRFLDSLRRSFSNGKISLQEQRQIIDSAGRWYVFWGMRGNPVWANY